MKKRRDKSKNPGLNKRFFSRIKQEYHDIDYADQLTEEEKEWLSNFMEEDLGANFKHKGERIMDKEGEKESYRRNNSRNRDLYSLKKGVGLMILNEFNLDHDADVITRDNIITTEISTETGYDPTDDIIELIDKKNGNSED